MDDNTYDFDLAKAPQTIIKVIGVGGGGGNAVSNMYREGIRDVSFVLCNTDNQALQKSEVPNKLLIGQNTTHGLGSGNVPEVGEKAALESKEDISRMLDDGTRMAFVTAGMGGGTGTGAGPVVAKISKDMGILTVGIVTIPFVFEGRPKIVKALRGVRNMAQNVDSLLVINNERLRNFADMPVPQANRKADETLTIAAKSIAEIITIRGKINLDFNDVKTVLKDGGVALMSTGYGSGEGRVTQAINDALHSPLLHNNDIFNSKKVLFNISYSTNSDLMMEEMNEVHEFMSRFGDDVETKWGLYIDDSLESKVKFTILATGFGIKDIPGMDDALNKKRTAEEQKRHEEEERIRQIKEKRRDDYYTNERRNDRKKGNYKYYIFTQDDLDNDDVISIVDTTPTYKRSKTVLDNIRQRATDSESLVQKPQLNENGSTMITFS